jgi:predicted metalloprotease with PDZ domain
MKGVSLLFLSVCISLATFAQSILYQFSAPNAAHHEAEIGITVDKLPAGPAYFRMSRSSPGRYAKHEFGKNVYNVKAFDAAGKPLKTEKADADVYRIPEHKGTVKVTYTLYANYADGTYASIDPTGYHLNIPATFMWVKGLDNRPITIKFNVPDSFKIATQLKPGSNAKTFTAPGLQYFMDSPIKIGDLQIREWKVTNPDKKQYTFRLALEADAPDAAIDEFSKKVEKIVQEAKAVFGEVPAYDYGTYTFLASINPYAKGDGMEHRNSTMITQGRNFDGGNSSLGTFAHEFFHCWNVERIRPRDLEPFDFEKSNMSEGLWVAEGFTQYYGSLLMMRAGLVNETRFLDDMAGLINTKLNTPGGKYYSPIENSQRAVFVDAGVSIDKTNYPNMYSSYYTYGGAIALALDLDLRSRFKKVSLDNYMQELWKRFGKTQKPYSINDLQLALAAITNNIYAADFFKKYVYGHEPYSYADIVDNANLSLIPRNSGKAWMGEMAISNLSLQTGTIKNTPLYDAGLDINDVLISMDGKSLASNSDVESILKDHKPGDKVALTYRHRGKNINTELLFAENPSLRLEQKQLSMSNEQQLFKQSWLGGKVD